MGNTRAGIKLGQTLVDLCQNYEALDCVVDGGIGRQVLKRLEDPLFRRLCWHGPHNVSELDAICEERRFVLSGLSAQDEECRFRVLLEALDILRA